MPTPPAAPPGDRMDAVDAARGLAILQMIAYHFCYDLDHFGWIRVRMLVDPGWIAWRDAIVAQFLLLVGVSLALRAGATPGALRPNWRRWAQIALCAALVSAASFYLFGARWIWFGVLHFVALAQLLLLPLARRGLACLALGAAILAAGALVHFPLFAAPALSWIGFSPLKPGTEDFVPLVPWAGVVLIGIGAANAALGRRAALARRLRRPLAGAWRLPCLLGRWPLTVYMAHQPLLFGALSLLGSH